MNGYHLRSQATSLVCLPGGADDARAMLVWLAGVHDIGKATPAFAVKARAQCGIVARAGLDLGVSQADARRAPHGALGDLVLRDWLKRRYPRSRQRARAAISVVVGAHHGVLPSSHEMAVLDASPHYFGGPRWQQARDEILDVMAQSSGAFDRLEQWLNAVLPATAQAHLAAAVVVADWLASDERRFPYDRVHPLRPEWTDLGLPTPWAPQVPPRDPAALLANRFPQLSGCTPTPIQTAAIEAAWTADTTPLIILEAEMGSGKTEAGLAAAEVLAHRFGAGGVFVALPTMATSDAMFARVRAWVDQLPGNGPLSMYLAHGKAGLNDDYRGLVDDQRVFAGVYDEDAASASQAIATVNSWTRGRRKGVLAPLVVGTIDQVLFGALRSRHLALRHLALAGKIVVVDEVHAADTYMREYLSSILTWLGAYGTPVVLMSATLPSRQRRQLVTAYAAGAATRPADPIPRTVPIDMSGGTTYPRTAMLDSTVREVRTAQLSSRPRMVTVHEHSDDLEVLVSTLRTLLSDGGCAGVIRNTVRSAQLTHDALTAALGREDVVLVHSRFLAVDRAHREADLRSRLGRDGSLLHGTRPERLVVVGTQVLEQSLDIDLDVMISDLAPIDLLLQRVGRLHRHPRGPEESERPEPLRRPQLLLVGADWTSTPVVPALGSRRVYGHGPLLRAAATLRAHGRVLRLGEDIPTLVEVGYDDRLTPPPGWEDAWDAATKDDCRRQEEAIARAGAFRLAAPTAGDGLLARSGFFVKGDPDDGSGGRSQVRDSEDSIEVVVVRRVGTEIRPMPGAELPEDMVLPTDFAPEPWVARALAACTVRLPSWSTARDIDAVITALEKTSFAGWQQDCPWLAGQLVLVLDDNLSARVAGLELSYSRVTGLSVTTVREDE